MVVREVLDEEVYEGTEEMKIHNENPSIFVDAPPVYAWRCELTPKVYWHCEEGKQPNAFHRMTQRLVFGFKWERIKDE